MEIALSLLPLSETVNAESEAHVAQILAESNSARTPVYPIGGGTSLNLGLPANQQGIGLHLGQLSQVVDYPARDMTITVGAGITIGELRRTLAPESQRLAIDAPCSERATLGGIIASNHSGPLRFGHGTMRDHVIGIRAVDGRGQPFAGGGRVVKNVAGYDFCKLLTGSLGTLGVITEVTLKLKPNPESRALVCCCPPRLDQLETLLAGLVQSATTPVSIDYLTGRACELSGLEAVESGWLVVGFEGTAAEVTWLVDTLEKEWSTLETGELKTFRDDQAEPVMAGMVAFPADEEAPLVVKVTGLPSATESIVQCLSAVEEIDGIQAHAGNGVTVARFRDFPAEGLARVLDGKILPVAARANGAVTILSNPSGGEMTHHSVWGSADVPFDLMSRVKAAFDPQHILNPGRFVYQV